MPDNASSLNLLHDIAIPPDVSFWPPAPGWYVVLTTILIATCGYAWRKWQHWSSNAYRRVALHQLDAANNVPQIGEILRRTALAAAPRSVVAEKQGRAWLDWLSLQCDKPIPDVARTQLVTGIYGRTNSTDADVTTEILRNYAAYWIRFHQVTRDEADC